MRTIAISIDDHTVGELDGIVAASTDPRLSRSQLVRAALADFLAKHAREKREARDREAYAAHANELQREAAALIEDQAEL
jgi:metal-responsive CopG/Arc/MetJ family transcriptional regulator